MTTKNYRWQRFNDAVHQIGKGQESMLNKISRWTPRDKGFVVLFVLGLVALFLAVPHSAFPYGVGMFAVATLVILRLGRIESPRPEQHGEVTKGWPWK